MSWLDIWLKLWVCITNGKVYQILSFSNPAYFLTWVECQKKCQNLIPSNKHWLHFIIKKIEMYFYQFLLQGQTKALSEKQKQRNQSLSRQLPACHPMLQNIVMRKVLQNLVMMMKLSLVVVSILFLCKLGQELRSKITIMYMYLYTSKPGKYFPLTAASLAGVQCKGCLCVLTTRLDNL